MIWISKQEENEKMYIYCMKLIFTLSLLLSGLCLNAQLDSLLSLKSFDSPTHELQTYRDIAYFAAYENISISKEYGEKAIALAKEMESDSLLALAYNDATFAYHSEGNYTRLKELGEMSLALREASGDRAGIAASRSKIALAHQEMGNLKLAMEEYSKAAEIYLELGDAYRSAQIKNNVGNLLGVAKSYREAHDTQLEAAKLFLEVGDSLSYLLARTNAASQLISLNELTAAEQILKEDLALAQKLESIRTTEYFRNLGVINELQGDYLSAKSNFENILGWYEEVGSKSGMAFAHARLARTDIKLNLLRSAKNHLFEAEALYGNTGSWKEKEHLYQSFVDYYSAKRTFKNAIEYVDLVNAYQDSMLQEEAQKTVISLEKQLELKESKAKALANQLEAEKERAANEVKDLWIKGIIVFAVLLLIALFLFARKRIAQKEAKRKAIALEAQEEKVRISRDLHDHIGAELTLITSKLDVLSYRSEDEELKEKLDAISDFSRGAMQELRKTIWAAKENAISLSDFGEELNRFLERFEVESNVDFPRIAEEIPASKALGIYRICQEAVNNAIKHANCSNITIKIRSEQEVFSFQIIDDGKGFESEGENMGHGLNNMKARVLALGGQFKLENHGGTQISFDIPKTM